MFTGIVEELGKIKNIYSKNEFTEIDIYASKILEEIKVGDSISVNGVCLTVTYFNNNFFKADISPETYMVTNLRFLKKNDYVNLERALTLTKFLGGHLVMGHVDGLGEIIYKEKIKNFWKILIDIPKNLLKYVITKGSIAIDGISLTVNEVSNNVISLMIIPHTLENTNLKYKKVKDKVNIEVDIVGKYIENFLKYKDEKNSSNGITAEFLAQHGFLGGYNE